MLCTANNYVVKKWVVGTRAPDPYVVTGCFFFSLTQNKFDIVPVYALAPVSFTYLHTTIYTPRMKFLARPLIAGPAGATVTPLLPCSDAIVKA